MDPVFLASVLILFRTHSYLLEPWFPVGILATPSCRNPFLMLAGLFVWYMVGLIYP